jgi:type VI secretion system protein ImpA
MLNIASLLNPVSDHAPCGEDILFSPEFDKIQDARRFDDPTLEQGEWVTDIKEADWRFVIEQGTILLRDRTKDLRLAVWMTEALAKVHSFAGLRDGYRLTAQLCGRYWSGLHPEADPDDIEFRTGSIAWLASRSVQLVRELPLVERQQGKPLTFLDWETATALAEAIRREPDNAEQLAYGKPTVNDFDVARRALQPAYFVTLLADIRDSEAALNEMIAVLDEKAGEHMPSFRAAKEALDAIISLIERFAPKTESSGQGTQAVTGDAATSEAPAGRAASIAAAPTIDGPIKTRAQALAQLRNVAEFFRATEPHSPVAYLAARAAQWGEMPLDTWLRTVIKDGGTLSQLEELLGIQPKSE